MSASRLWVLTCLFNPAHFTRRIVNYRAFRARLSVPLLTVELVFDGRPDLTPADADVLVQIGQGDVMWQKERLLNLGVRHLPAECDTVAIVDADLVFENPDWPTEARNILARVPVAQLFGRAHYMPRDWRPGDATHVASGARGTSAQLGASRAIADGVDPFTALGPQTGDGRGPYSPGFAWGFRRALLERSGLFEGCVVGGGDTAVACAHWGAFDAVETRHLMTAAQRRFYRDWAGPWFDAVRGQVGCLGGDVFHLWHGELAHRMASDRHRLLATHDFDPRTDLVGAPGNAWRWATDKPGLHRALREYFGARREDG